MNVHTFARQTRATHCYRVIELCCIPPTVQGGNATDSEACMVGLPNSRGQAVGSMLAPSCTSLALRGWSLPQACKAVGCSVHSASVATPDLHHRVVKEFHSSSACSAATS